ncbi:hypothetical protein [Pedobacter sp. UBA5917]|jgi:hypothetical protein|uniref:hypothetical protein n=1 Tax=Pedobacter sp. UBA5917 TaxID=1947061 RepID=UPI0025EC442E|nr:hypothetical protein [Pedobacter sp. UBA5917]
MDIVILKDGTPVRFDDTFTNKSFDGITGFLLEFDFLLIRFRHYQKDDFKISDQEKWTQLDGYYKETDYQNYMLKNSSKKYESLLKFDFSKLTAVSGDIVNVDVLYLDEPYDYYFKNATYRFSVQNTIDNLGIKNYRKPIYQNVTLIGYEIDIPNNLLPHIQEKTPKNLATRYFYEANFGDFVGNWQVFSSTKRNLKKIVTQICFRISSIVRDIFPYITDLSIVDANADLRKDEFSGLNDYNIIIFELKKSWGYYYLPNSDPLYINRQKIEPTFSGESNYDEYLKYYEGLTNFYFNVYKIRSNFITLSDDRRFNYLLGMISPAALVIIPLKVIKKCLSYYSKTKELDESSQRFIIHIISSIIKRSERADIDDFLLFLLNKENGEGTNFEILYGLLTDGRIERIPYINMIFDEYTNKKYFAYAIYELWKVSKFNWDYFPPEITPIPGQIYDGNFFVKSHDEFNTNNIFEFSSVDNVESNLPFNTKVTFKSYFKNNKLNIYKTTRVLKYYSTGSGITPLADDSVLEEFGLFHLYQPITLIGYKPNLDLAFVVPQRGTIPAFLFHFAEEYKKIAEFDALISLSVDLTVNILLAYFGGGSSLLKNLNYLRYTKLGAAIIGEGVIATEAVVIWRNAEGTANIITLSVAELMSVNQYLTTTTTDDLEQKYLIRIQQLFLVLLIIGIGGTLYTRARATEAATRILDDIALLGTAAHGVPESILQILRSLKGEATVAKTIFLEDLNRINNRIPITNILFKYEHIFDESTKMRFWLNFRELNDIEWRRFSFSDDYLENWIQLNSRNIDEARFIDFITNQKLVDGIIRYSNEPAFKKILDTFSYHSKVNFLENFSLTTTKNFNRLREYPKVLEKWKTATGYSKALAEQNFANWIEQQIYALRYEVKYVGKPLQGALTDNYILQNFRQNGLVLRNLVENKAVEQLAENYKLSEKQVVVAFMEKEGDLKSEVFTNFIGKQKEEGKEMEQWLNNYGEFADTDKPYLQPSIRERLLEAEKYKVSGKLLTNDPFDITRAGPVASHAEFRSLNDLAAKKFGNNYIEPKIFDDWLKNDVLGYVMKIRPDKSGNIIQHTCVHCYYFTDLVTFMRIN